MPRTLSPQEFVTAFLASLPVLTESAGDGSVRPLYAVECEGRTLLPCGHLFADTPDEAWKRAAEALRRPLFASLLKPFDARLVAVRSALSVAA